MARASGYVPATGSLDGVRATARSTSGVLCEQVQSGVSVRYSVLMHTQSICIGNI